MSQTSGSCADAAATGCTASTSLPTNGEVPSGQISITGGSTVSTSSATTGGFTGSQFGITGVTGGLVLNRKVTSRLTGSAARGFSGLGNALDSLGQSGNTATASLLDAVNNLPSSQAVSDALKQIAPESNGASQQASQKSSGSIFSALSSRISAARSGLAMAPTGLSAGDGVSGRRSWVQGVGASGEQGARAEENGYKTASTAIAGGIEVDRSAREVAGVLVAYTKGNSTGTGAGTGDNVKLNGTHVGGYFSQTDPGMTLDLALLLGYNSYRSERQVEFSGFSERLTGNYSGWQLGGQTEAGFPFALAPQWSGLWLAGARAGYSVTNAYTEQGSEAVAQQVNRTTYKSLQSVLGVQLDQTLGNNSFLQYRTRYLHEFADSPSTTARMVAGGSSFSSPTSKANRDALQIGLGYRHLTKDGVTFKLEYDAEVKEKYSGHQLSARLIWAF